MKATIFAKKRKTKEGREFYTYITKLIKKDGTEVTCKVNMPDEVKPKPEKCPLNIIIEKEDANLTVKTEVNEETGEVYENKTLWVKTFTEDTEKYRDKSLDDFE